MNRLTLAKTYDIYTSDQPTATVVFVHGIASSSASYKGALEFLKDRAEIKGARLVAFDLLGAGKSYTSDELNYDYKEQITALKNSIDDLEVDGPIILVAHSMGTLIAVKFTEENKALVKNLILVSPPIYRPEDMDMKEFGVAMDGFRQAITVKDKAIAESKAFKNEIKNIVMDRSHYARLCALEIPTAIIFGDLDRIIGAINIPKVLKANPRITAERVPGGHGVTPDKYHKLMHAIEKAMKG